jgi:hypothetical protein
MEAERLSASVMVSRDVAGISCYLRSIMPRFEAMVTACVRSFVASFTNLRAEPLYLFWLTESFQLRSDALVGKESEKGKSYRVVRCATGFNKFSCALPGTDSRERQIPDKLRFQRTLFCH